MHKLFNKLTLALLIVFLASGLLMANTHPIQTNQKSTVNSSLQAKQILKNMEKAIDPNNKLSDIKSLFIVKESNNGNKNVLAFDAPDSYLLKIVDKDGAVISGIFISKGKVEKIVNGEKSDLNNDDNFIAGMKFQILIDTLQFNKIYEDFILNKETVSINDKNCLKITAVNKLNSKIKFTMYIDQKDYLLRKTETDFGSSHTYTIYQDYAKFDGITLPKTTETYNRILKDNKKVSVPVISYTVEKFEINESIPKGLFTFDYKDRPK